MRELDVKTGFACNNNCVFCLCRKHSKYPAFPLDEIKNQIKKSAGRGGKRLIISGGEPSISPDFFTILRYGKECGFRDVEIQTNGRMLYYEAFLKKILDVRPVHYMFLVSLHFPDKKLHQRYIRADGFDQVIAGITNLVKNDLPFVINTVVMKQNLGLLGDVTELVQSIGAKRQQFRMIDGYSFRKNFRDFVPPMKKAALGIRKAIEKNKQDDFKFFVRELPLCVLGKDMKNYLAPLTSSERSNMRIGNIVKTFDTIRREKFVFADSCGVCSHRAACMGVRKTYAQLYGLAELKPFV